MALSLLAREVTFLCQMHEARAGGSFDPPAIEDDQAGERGVGCGVWGGRNDPEQAHHPDDRHIDTKYHVARCSIGKVGGSCGVRGGQGTGSWRRSSIAVEVCVTRLGVMFTPRRLQVVG